MLMKKIAKLLSHEDRISGRVLSGGCRLSLNSEIGRSLTHEIERGFFEKKIFDNVLIARQLYLPFTLFHTFRKTPLN